MNFNIYTLQWIILIVGVFFLILSIYTLTQSNKRDKIISIGIFLFCVAYYGINYLSISYRNKEAEIYFGTYELESYLESDDYKIEILPDREYRIFNETKTVINGEWSITHPEDTLPPILFLEDGVFGVGKYAIK